MGATLAPDRILKELAELWVSMGKPGEGESGAGVLRACSMTLVVLAEESDDMAALGETLAALMPEHPARAMVVRLRGGGGPAGSRVLEDRVYAQCWMPFGQRRQICCEQIEITASDASLGDVPSLVLPLAVPDLPVMVWCRSPRLIAMAEFGGIAAMAHKVVVDSQAFAGPDGLRRIAGFSRSGMVLGDLAWTRLTRWREMLAQVFENRDTLAQAAGISSVRVAFSGDYRTLALYMGAWTANALRTAGVHPELAVVSEAAPEAGLQHFLRVEMLGGSSRLRMEREEDRLVIEVNGNTSCTNLPHPTDYLLMREELGIVRRDPIFESTLAQAAQLA